MAAITIRTLSDEVVAALKQRAKRNSRSMEAEVRDVLTRIAQGEELTSGIETYAAAQLMPRRWSVPGSEIMARLAANPLTPEQRKVREEWLAEIEADRRIPDEESEWEDPWERAEKDHQQWLLTAKRRGDNP